MPCKQYGGEFRIRDIIFENGKAVFNCKVCGNRYVMEIAHMNKEVKEILEAVDAYQRDDYVMSEAEAKALSDTSSPNRPKIEPKSLPMRSRV
jgi:transcription elongation factor Elf1